MEKLAEAERRIAGEVRNNQPTISVPILPILRQEQPTEGGLLAVARRREPAETLAVPVTDALRGELRTAVAGVPTVEEIELIRATQKPPAPEIAEGVHIKPPQGERREQDGGER